MLDLEEGYRLFDGTVRAISPEETYSRAEPFFEDFGITRVADVTGMDNIGIPVMLSVRPNAKSLSVAQGKGITTELAKVSAVMESIEHFHAEQPISINIIDSYANLSAEHDMPNPIHLANPLFSSEHLEQEILPWTQGINLLTGKKALLPMPSLSLDSTQADRLSVLLYASTNGLASGNTLDEAICHALLEVIERDSTFAWKMLKKNEQNQTIVDVETIQVSFLIDLITKIQQADIKIKIYNQTAALGVPTFFCLIGDNRPSRRLALFGGYGTHLNKAIALSRAITEAVQSRITSITGSRDDMTPEFYGDWHILETEEVNATLDYSKIVEPGTQGSFEADKKYLLNRLAERDCSAVYMYNFTNEKYRIPVVRIIVPHLQFLSE